MSEKFLFSELNSKDGEDTKGGVSLHGNIKNQRVCVVKHLFIAFTLHYVTLKFASALFF